MSCRPGRDIIHLVTVVSGHMHVEAGQALLDTFYSQVARALVEARQEVLVRSRVHASRTESVAG
jgi:hypothetical protein